MFYLFLPFFCYSIGVSSVQTKSDTNSEHHVDEQLIERLHLLTLRRRTFGSASGILHFASSGTNLQPVCFDFFRCDAGFLNFVSHQLCVRQGFQTVREHHLINKKIFAVNDLNTINAWNTSIREDVGSISCTLGPEMLCSHLLQIECGDCHFSFTVSNNDIYIRSPLYPTAVAGLICKYDISSNYQLGVSILSLDVHPAVQTSVGQSKHCMHSFLQIQSIIKTSGQERIGDLYTLCGQLDNKIILTNGKHVRLLFVTGKSSSGSLLLPNQTGFLVRISKSSKSSKLLQGIIVGCGILVPSVCFLCIFCSHKLTCGKCKKKKVRGRRRDRVHRYRNHHHSTWIGDLPTHGQTLHEAGTTRLQRFVESEENSYVMDNRVSARNFQIQRPLPEIPEETINRPNNSEVMRSDSNNNIAGCQISSHVPDITLYESLHQNIKVEKKEEHTYLSLVNSATDIDGGVVVESEHTKTTSENCTIDNQDEDNCSAPGVPPRSCSAPGVPPRSRTSTKRFSRSSMNYKRCLANTIQENPEISNLADNVAKLTGTSNLLATPNISVADEDWLLTPNGLTPIKPSNGSGMTIFSRNLSMIGARLASIASYTSITRKTQNEGDESLNLLDDGIDYESSLKDEDDDVFQEN